MRYETISVEDCDGVTVVALNRPEAMNSINSVMQAELEEAFNRFAADERQMVAIVTGSGTRAFCAGSDLKEIAHELTVDFPDHGYAGIAQRFDLDKPLIAAVEGVALGGGFEIALACDIIIAGQGARFGLPEPRIGGLALGGGIHRLSRQIGLKRAMGFMLTGRLMDSTEAHDLGLVNEVVESGGALAAARRWAEEILQCAPLSVRATKDIARRGLAESSLEAALASQSEMASFKTWAAAQDTREGPKAFAEKRSITWSGC